jgi:hypothetical protein
VYSYCINVPYYSKFMTYKLVCQFTTDSAIVYYSCDYVYWTSSVSLVLERIGKLLKLDRDLPAELSPIEMPVVAMITKTEFRETQLTMCPTKVCLGDRKISASEIFFFVFSCIRRLTKFRNLNIS